MIKYHLSSNDTDRVLGIGSVVREVGQAFTRAYIIIW